MVKRHQIPTMFIGFAILILVIANIAPTHEEPARTITVSATGEVFSLSERAYITISVQKDDIQGKNIADILNETTETLNNFEIQHIDGFFTTYLNGYKHHEEERYSVNQTVQIIVSDLSMIDDLLEALTENLTINNYNLYFVPERSDKLEQDATSYALVNARQQAQFLASQTNNTIGDIVELKVNDAYHSIQSSHVNYDYAQLMPEADLEEMTVHPSPSRTTVGITVTFELK